MNVVLNIIVLFSDTNGLVLLFGTSVFSDVSMNIELPDIKQLMVCPREVGQGSCS
jgi:uncharacterized membrane protein YesL